MATATAPETAQRRRRPIQLFVHVDETLKTAVEKAARDDERTPPDYVRRLLRRELRRAGYLPEPDET